MGPAFDAPPPDAPPVAREGEAVRLAVAEGAEVAEAPPLEPPAAPDLLVAPAAPLPVHREFGTDAPRPEYGSR